MNRQVDCVENNQKRAYSRDTYNSLRPITWLLNIFGLNSNVEHATYSKAFYIFKCFIIITVLGSLDLSSLYYKIVYLYPNTAITSSIKLTDTVQMLYDLCQYIVDLWFVYKYGRQISLEYFRQYEYIDEILGMPYYSKIKWKLMMLLGVFTFIWLLTSVFDFVAWYLSYGWITPTAYGIAYLFLYIKILTTLDLSSHVMHIKYRLKIIGDEIHHYYFVTESLPGSMGNFICNKNWLQGKKMSQTLQLTPRLNFMKLQSADECKEINWLTRCYLQLTEQVEYINSMFGFRILLNSLSLLIDIIRFTNIAVRIVLGTQLMPNESKYFPVVSSMMRQMICILVLVSLVNHCENTYRERDRIISTIDQLLINKKPNDELRVAMMELRGLIKARPINFNLANFFTLDNSFLVSIASVVVTYTIILLQTMN